MWVVVGPSLGACGEAVAPATLYEDVTVVAEPPVLLGIGATATLTATGLDPGGVERAVAMTWRSESPGVVTVDPSGVVRSVAYGTATVSGESPEVATAASYDIESLPAYVLPYPVGAAYTVIQGWNGSFSHSTEQNRYALDFAMPIGDAISAARSGRVVVVVQDHPDGTRTAGDENLVIVDHGDGTFAIYSHLTTGGALAQVGSLVDPGDPIGLSGDSGFSFSPHLHFHVAVCAQVGCASIPIYFTNTPLTYPDGLPEGAVWPAGPFGGEER